MQARYALISPARNEGRYIENTIRSVIAQTVLPVKWAIVSDRSTDDTDAIVERYSRSHPFIKLVRLDGEAGRDYSCKVRAINSGYAALKDLDFEYIGNLDADVSFKPDYFEDIITRFQNDSALGIAGGIVQEDHGGRIVEQRISAHNVAGANILFRRICYDAIGGFLPLRSGGEDGVACIMARMLGWKVTTFYECKIDHHKSAAQRGSGVIEDKMRWGRMFYEAGYHPLFEVMRCIMRLNEKPYVLGSGMELLGYMAAPFSGSTIQVPREVVRFLRKDQLGRLVKMFNPFERTRG